MPLVSVLMPVYNVEKYIILAIESVLNQSLNDIEIIIVDDGSTDKTFSIASYYSTLDSRVKVYKNDYNLGISRTLNVGLKHCTSPYIARMDGDDIMDFDRLLRQYNFLENNKDYGLVGCWIKNINESGDEIGLCEYPCTHENVLLCIGLTSPVLHIWMGREIVYQKLDGYRDTNPAEDYDFLLRSIDYGFKVGNLPYYGAYIRLRGGNTMSTASLKQRKAFNYLSNLFRVGEININQTLDFSKDNILNVNSFVSYIHKISTSFLKIGLENKLSIKGCFFLVASTISPYTIQDIIRRQKFKKIIKKNNLSY